jgi:hypothetical protein
MNDAKINAFLDELEKIAQKEEQAQQIRESLEDLRPGPQGVLERAAPVAGTIAGTLGGRALAGALSPGVGGWRGMALKGLGGVGGGLGGLLLGGAGQKALIRGRREEALGDLRDISQRMMAERRAQMGGAQ